MTLPYIKDYEEYGNTRMHNIHGSFIDPQLGRLNFINPKLSSHDEDPILKTFRYWFNPKSRYAPYSKEEAIKILRNNIKYYQNLGIKQLSSDAYFQFKLNYYFLQVYLSKKTNIRDGINVVDLSYTTGYYPEFEYFDDSDAYSFNYPERAMFEEDELDILKSILVQACDVDSLELAIPKTILTSKFNIYETFYNYLLNDYKIQVVPKKVYDSKEQRFINFKLNEFLVPDSELRLKDEIEAIRKRVPREERSRFYR